MLSVVVIAVALIVVTGALLLAWFIVNKPSKQDYQGLAAARKELTEIYTDLHDKTAIVTESADFLSAKSKLTFQEYSEKSGKLTASIEALGRNKAVQADSTLRNKYMTLKQATERFTAEFGKIFRDVERMQQATKDVEGLTYSGPEAAANSKKMRLALESIQGLENQDIARFIKDIIVIYKDLEPLYTRYYANGPGGDSSMSNEMLSKVLELLKPVGVLSEALTKTQNEVDITDELNDFYKEVNKKLKAEGIETTPITKKYCLEYEKLCLQIPVDWQVDAKTVKDTWLQKRVDEVTFKSADGMPIMNIYETGGSVGGKCQEDSPVPLKVKYKKPEDTLFDDDSYMNATGLRSGNATVAKLVMSDDGGKTWKFEFAGKNYLTNPKWSYYNSAEENEKLKPIFDQELTLTDCASTLTRYNTAFRVPSKHISSDEVPAVLVIERAYCDEFRSGTKGSPCKTTTYRSADEALADPDLESAVYAIKTASYEEQQNNK